MSGGALISRPGLETVPCRVCGADDPRPGLDKHGLVYVRCGSCGLLYVRERPDAGRRSAHQEEWAARHHATDERVADDDSAVKERLLYGPYLRRLEPFRQTGHLLDVGCGSGGFLAAARRRDWAVSGVELSRTNVQVARQVRGLDVRRGSLEGAGFPDGRFDAVTLWEVIEHVPDPGATLAEAVRVLRPGGALFLSTPNAASLSRLVLGADYPPFIPWDHLQVFTAATLREALGRAGLRVERLVSRELNPFLIAGFLRRRRRPAAASNGEFETHQAATRQAKGALAARAWVRLTRAVVNAALRWTGLGDVLEALARKPASPPSRAGAPARSGPATGG